MDAGYERIREADNAVKRNTYAKRKEEGLCTRCGKRWAEAGRTKCRPCRERDQKWYRDNGMREYLCDYKRIQRADRKANNLCVDCGRPLKANEIGVHSSCAMCLAKERERTNVNRIRMRIHGIKRKS